MFINFPPKSIWRVISILLSKSADGIIDGAANFVADLPQLVTEREWTFILLPVIVPPSPGVAGIIPVPRWEEENSQQNPNIVVK